MLRCLLDEVPVLYSEYKKLMTGQVEQNDMLRWKTCRGELDLTMQAAIMGILNMTPDSFSDGGQYNTLDTACERAMQMIREGAAIIDIGGESTRPGADYVSPDLEISRVVPIIKRLRAESDVLISIDTSKAVVADAAIAAGADMVNDITAMGDPRMAPVVAASGAGIVLMHMQGRPQTMQQHPQYQDVVLEVGEFLRQRMDTAIASGIDPMCIALDPGIGFGKSHEHNRTLIRSMDQFGMMERPFLLGVSRKSFLGWAANAPKIEDRLWGGVATTCLGRELGVRIFRTHDVRPNVEALRMTEAILHGVTRA